MKSNSIQAIRSYFQSGSGWMGWGGGGGIISAREGLTCLHWVKYSL